MAFSGVLEGGNALGAVEAFQKASAAELREVVKQATGREGLLIQQLKHRDELWTNKTHHLRDAISKLERELERVRDAAAEESAARGREVKALRQELSRARAAGEAKTGELGEALNAKAGLADQMDTFLRRADEKIEGMTAALEAEQEARAKEAKVRAAGTGCTRVSRCMCSVAVQWVLPLPLPPPRAVG